MSDYVVLISAARWKALADPLTPWDTRQPSPVEFYAIMRYVEILEQRGVLRRTAEGNLAVIPTDGYAG